MDDDANSFSPDPSVGQVQFTDEQEPILRALFATITQLTKERDLALERIGVLEGVLTKCKDTFWHYQSLHAAKVPADTVKARANGDMARMCEAAITPSTGTEG